jgi:hypothetical protein
VRGAVNAIGVILLAALVASPGQAASLRDQLPAAAQQFGLRGGGVFDAFADSIADTAARNLPVLAASAGYTYTYNPELDIFERTSDVLGPLFLERPDTLGRGKFNVNVSYQYVDFNSVDGVSSDALEARDPIIVQVVSGGSLLGFTANRLRYDLDLRSHITAFSATYGVLDNLDVNVLVPLIQTNFDVKAENQVLFVAGPDGLFLPQRGPVQRTTRRGEAFGVGDVLLRGKYQLPRLGEVRSAAGLQLRLPSGNQDDFQGTGTFEASPFLYLSTVLWSRVEPHANLGVDLRADDVERSQARYGVGVNVDATRRIGVALAFLGRSEFTRSSSTFNTDFLHLTATGAALRPILGVDLGRKDYFDLSFGVRIVTLRRIMVFVNGIHALNDDGLRNDTIIPTIGVESTF